MDEVTELETAQHIEKQFIDEEQKLEILKVIQKQQSPLKDVLMLRLLGDLSFREIGEILGKNENWARVIFYRGKQIIGKELKQNA